MGNLKNEYKSFLDDIEKNIKNKEDLEYVKERFADFMDIVLNDMGNILDYKDEEMKKLEVKQNEIETEMNKLKTIVDHIEKDIYDEDGFDFEIVCPYCNYEFVIDVDDNKTEVQCPECKNIIELDWNGGEDEEGCNGSCHGCSGCDDVEDEDDDM